MSRPKQKSSLKIIPPTKISSWSKKFQRKGQKLVFTNGCFDLLHSGHVSYLEEARNLGDGLIIGLNSDASVKRLKGKDRPLVTLKDRARVIAALECVDAVTWFTQDTPEQIIKKVLPKILVKGGDWPVEKIVGAETVLKSGGEVRSLQFVDGQSTTRLIKKAREGK